MQRYSDKIRYDRRLVPDENGEWVRYKDAVREIAAARKAAEVVESALVAEEFRAMLRAAGVDDPGAVLWTVDAGESEEE